MPVSNHDEMFDLVANTPAAKNGTIIANQTAIRRLWLRAIVRRKASDFGGSVNGIYLVRNRLTKAERRRTKNRGPRSGMVSANRRRLLCRQCFSALAAHWERSGLTSLFISVTCWHSNRLRAGAMTQKTRVANVVAYQQVTRLVSQEATS